MNLFVIAAVVLTGLAVVLVIRPLLRKTGEAPAAPVAAVALGLALPAAVLFIYMSVSNHDWSAPNVANSPVTAAEGGGAGMPNIADMVAQLEERLKNEPDDIAGWLMLGRTYAQLQQAGEARRAYRRALALSPGPEAKLGVAEAEIILDRNSLLGEAGQLIEEVLVIEPQNPKALFYGGMVAMARNDVDEFRSRWRLLLTMSPPDEIRRVIETQLAMADALPGQSKKTETVPGITVNVSLSGGLVDEFNPAAILYLVARDPKRPGPPLAVVRQVAPNLPATLNISDANAMVPGSTLSSLPRLRLIARITNSGEPVAQPGDLFGESDWSASENAGQDISIVIDRVVE